MSATLGEDAIDEVLYLARANEAKELEEYLTSLSSQMQKPKDELIAAAIDPYSKNSALHYAAANGHTDVVKLLLPPKSDKATSTSSFINAINEAGNTALHWAALNGHLECVKLLVESGADVTIINKAGHDAVFEAEINGKEAVVDWLLGAVEALEKGIAGAEGVDSDDAANESFTIKAGEPVAADVDGVRNDMERLQTSNSESQGG
ncbi:ankyrin [Sporormia fimetaria CBS 119925]|uniref:Ankyrin n=1 Tax=Sporormia fimetaria CBS 119925 TaxID=1340428 RepID=A0A6A6UXH4_9PLEO|nr:ankyrin [Sporormia fimetaria CBS 119925]